MTCVNGQAGEVVYDDFDAFYRLAANACLGLNGYVMEQLTLDRTSGMNLSFQYIHRFP